MSKITIRMTPDQLDALDALYEPAPDLAAPRATLVTEAVVDLLDAATHRLDLRYPLMPHQPEELAVRDVAAATDELRAIVELLCQRVALLEEMPR